MSKIPEDLLPMRETKLEVLSTAVEKPENVFAVCLETDDTELLVPLKIYQVSLRGKNVRVIDEKGEVAVYPSEFFLPLQLPREAANTLTKVYAQIV